MLLASAPSSAQLAGGVNIVYAISIILGAAALLGGFAWVFRKSATKARLADLALQLDVMRGEMNDWRQRAQDYESDLTKVKTVHATVQAKMSAAIDALKAENVVLTEKVTNAAAIDTMARVLERIDAKLDTLVRGAA